MFSKVALFVAATMAVFVTAAPSGAGSCNTGPIQCCDEMHHKDSRPAALLLSKVGVNVQDVTGDVGATCSPITAVGLGSGASCSQQPVCCQNNSFNGVVVIGCSPININL